MQKVNRECLQEAFMSELAAMNFCLACSMTVAKQTKKSVAQAIHQKVPNTIEIMLNK